MSSRLLFILTILFGVVEVSAVEVGEAIWTFETGAAIRSSPALGRDGTLYVGSE
ncbi:MAG: PQQ-binding-like beta-propeller repeat protein, partial [Opitutae bacterium]|nr:PQQ-binding-like beta-propeller repeat protein [Opitutae bacterium]